MNSARVIFRKELVDHVRDRRSMATVLWIPAFGAITTAVMLTFIGDLQKDRELTVPVIGVENAPGLVAFLEQHGATIEAPPLDPANVVTTGESDMVLIISKEYGERFQSGRPATVQLMFDQSRTRAHANVDRVRRLLQAYSQQIGTLRLFARGVSPELATALQIDELDLATPERLAVIILGIIPTMLMLSVLMGALNVAIDVTAGERERGSLEPLLLNPTSRMSVVVGKWLAAVVAGVAVLALTIAAFAGVLALFPLADLGLRASLGMREIALILVAIIPLAWVGSGVQMFVASFARSFKEAQTYLSVLNLLPMIPAMIVVVAGSEGTAWMMAIPAVSQTVVVLDLLRGEMIPVTWLLTIVGSSVAYTLLCIWGLAHLLGREKIIFGR
ncbi:MAG: hypothetical protein A2289_16155 [Deltaproteobacteria bacterium RIFOXYA12_FULL_58_15]|nr:MAG: hypothetical protein A2289_16155 [Deltaproteobacteria bacterium RIFOXYA12_FULL_58_15]OGR15229.1 MAG: hypothetical protein A2341_09045 [Deltaproteobacteria bacterium RIFOXYB12_FULL_58_9]